MRQKNMIKRKKPDPITYKLRGPECRSINKFKNTFHFKNLLRSNLRRKLTETNKFFVIRGIKNNHFIGKNYRYSKKNNLQTLLSVVHSPTKNLCRQSKWMQAIMVSQMVFKKQGEKCY